MPGPDELTYRDYADFTGGLWQRSDDRECAPNGLLECTDCFPLPSGGLKAFAAFEPIATGFSTPPTGNTWVLGIWSMPQGGIGGFRNWFMLCIDAGANVNLYSLSGSGGSFEGFVRSLRGDAALTWTLIHTKTIASLDTGIRMVPYRTDAGGGSYFNYPTSTNGGIWESDGSTAVLRFSSTVAPFAFSVYGVWTHQGRLLTLTDEGTGNQQNSIIYTDAGSSAAPSTANFLRPLGETAGAIRGLVPSEPSELLFWKGEVAVGDVQGAITAPTVRQNAYQHTLLRGFPVQTPLGVVCVIQGEGAYLWGGQGLEYISAPILGDGMGGTPVSTEDDDAGVDQTSDLIGATFSAWRGQYACVTGQLGAYEHWVFFNNGYVLDSRTGAWFTQTSAPGARYWGADQRRRLMFVSCNTPFSVQASQPFPPAMYFSQMGESNWIPMHEMSYTLPLIESVGQRTNLREIEYDVTTYNAESTLTVEATSADGTDNVTLGPYTLGNTRPDSVRITVPGHPQEWYKVRTVLKSNRPQEEAPSVSKMRVGTQPSTRNPVNKVSG